jgi:hypothetical protein
LINNKFWSSTVSNPKPSLIRWTRRIINWLLWICCVLAVPLCIGSVLMIAVALSMPEPHPLWEEWFPHSVVDTRLMMALGSAAFMGMLLAAIPMLRELLRIIDSAMTGDPFVPENARRLHRIGWLLLLMNLLFEADEWISEGDFLPAPGGLLTVLLVFVLAQIFDKGSQMRAELQETI